MAVDTVLDELSEVLPDYELIRDCLAGSRAVKKKKSKYLPIPDPDDSTPYGIARYDSYVGRAVFYNVTERTHKGLVGLVYDKDPAVEIPDQMDVIKADANGAGIPLDQLAKMTLGDVVGLGRAGIFVDYPKTGRPTTVAEARTGNIRPTIVHYAPEQIINWRTRTVGAQILLELVVLREAYVKSDDGFTHEMGVQHRVLRLLPDGTYQQELWRENVMEDSFIPTDGAAKPFRFIPFTFVGAEDNSPSVDKSPMLGIADLNIAHYRNSADYEESIYIVGQPTPVFAGLSEHWVQSYFMREVDDGHGQKVRKPIVRFGSRVAIPLPQGGSAELLQAQPNSVAFEGMEHKEKQMIALGAKLIENVGTQQTATEATQDNVMDNSILGVCARNVSDAYTKALGWCWLYMTGQLVEDEDVIDYELNTDFAARMLTAADRTEIVGEWQKGAITYTEMRWNMKRSGIAYLDDEEAKAESEAEKQTKLEFEAAAAGAIAKASGNLPPGNSGGQ